MRDTDESQSAYRFGAFELDPRTSELRKHGVRIKLQDQPLHILVLLLERSGEIVTREQIQNKLWTASTYVDYDNAINGAIRKLRGALGDTAENPRFIETFARRGYRFVGHLEGPRQIEEPVPLAQQRPAPTLPVWKISSIGLAIASLVFLAMTGAGAWWVLGRHTPGNRLQLNPVPLTGAIGLEGEPSFSPDGTRVAYVWDEGAPHLARHIFVKLIGEGTPLRLTSSPNQDRSPAWSPNGRSIAFLRQSDSGGGIYVIPALGGAERKVAHGYFPVNGLFARSISWSPDGRFLVLSESNSPGTSPALTLLNVENGEKLPLTTTPNTGAMDMNPVFSPDGRKLLFTRCRSGCELYVLTLSKSYRPIGTPASLKQGGPDIEGAVWTTDGRDIVYSLYKADYLASIMRVRALAGAQPERLVFTNEVPFSPFSLTIAPLGNRLAYTAVLFYVQIWQVEPGKTPRSFVSSTRFDSSPEFSPDGKRVVFASSRSGALEIWTCDSSGRNPTQVTHFNSGFVGTPRWSPDGRSIAFDRRVREGWNDQGWGIFVSGSDGSQLRQLTSGKVRDIIPSWSADGKWIYYSSNRTNRSEIWKAAASGGESIQVTRNGGRVAFESPDGQFLYHTKAGQSGLWELPLRGGEERRLLAVDVGVEFAVTKDGIYYLPAGTRSVRFHSLATGKDKEIALLNVRAAQGLTVSPDRKTILFTADLHEGTNVMIVDNFH